MKIQYDSFCFTRLESYGILIRNHAKDLLVPQLTVRLSSEENAAFEKLKNQYGVSRQWIGHYAVLRLLIELSDFEPPITTQLPPKKS